ncbi:hypothetical protein [Halostagnicola larsenii]|nr:hypothetical protein [Halostagnicola larsenii]
MTTLDLNDLSNLSGDYKGNIGEAIGSSYFEKYFRNHPHLLFKGLDAEDAKIYVQKRTNIPFESREVSDTGKVITKRWEADFKFTIDIYGRDDIERQTYLLEIKTGPYAEPERSQLEVMERLARNPEYNVLTCNIQFSNDGAELKFKEAVEKHSEIVWMPQSFD